MFVDGPPGTIGPDGKPTETITEENYFFKLSELSEATCSTSIEANPNFMSPAVRNEVLSFLRGNVSESGTRERSRRVEHLCPARLKTSPSLAPA